MHETPLRAGRLGIERDSAFGEGDDLTVCARDLQAQPFDVLILRSVS